MPDATPTRGSAVVEFVDARGVLWRVSERDSRGDPGALREMCLIFACTDAVRRVWFYPDDWRGLAPEALAQLSWQK